MTEQHELDRLADDGCPHEGPEEPRYGPSPLAEMWTPWSAYRLICAIARRWGVPMGQPAIQDDHTGERE